MNSNKVSLNDFSNAESKLMYQKNWPTDPGLYQKYEGGEQCGGCSFFAPLNSDYGICCNKKSRHYIETIFEHFTCPSIVFEGWDSHSFDEKSAKI